MRKHVEESVATGAAAGSSTAPATSPMGTNPRTGREGPLIVPKLIAA